MFLGNCFALTFHMNNCDSTVVTSTGQLAFESIWNTRTFHEKASFWERYINWFCFDDQDQMIAMPSYFISYCFYITAIWDHFNFFMETVEKDVELNEDEKNHFNYKKRELWFIFSQQCWIYLFECLLKFATYDTWDWLRNILNA